MTTTYLNNAFSLNMLDLSKQNEHIDIEVTPISTDEANSWLGDDFESGIRYESTAGLVGAILGREIEVPEKPKNIKLDLCHDCHDTLVVAQYTGPRLAAGVTELPEGATLQFVLVRAC